MGKGGWALAGAAAALFAGAAAAERAACADSTLTVDFAAPGDFQSVCEGTRRALRFLVEAGFEAALPVEAVVSEAPQDGDLANSIGFYDAASGRLQLLPFAVARARAARNPPFGVEWDAELYTSFVAHETAHAIAHANFATRRPARIAHEYLAYTVQLATMAPAQRSRILEKNPVDGFAREDEMSLSYYLLAPNAFGIKSYLHYLRPENGARFLREIVADRALRANQ